MTNFSIIIPNFNGAQYLPDCLKSIFAAVQNCPNCQFELILVDNGSTDNSIDVFNSLLSNYSSLTSSLCTLSSNLGFAAAVNRGIMAAKYDWLVLLNNDLTVAPNWFQLISPVITKDYACFCGTVLNKTGDKIESLGLKFFPRGKCLNIGNDSQFSSSDPAHQSTSLPIWGASAAAVIYNREILINSGLFDEDFFAYEEDVDVALRLNKLGCQTLYIPRALSYHLGGGTSRKMGNLRHRMDAKNWFFIIIKNYSCREIILNFLPIIVERFRNLSGLIKNTPPGLIPMSVISTYSEVIKKIPVMLKKRKQLQILLKSKCV